jgi:hypothetical protein
VPGVRLAGEFYAEVVRPLLEAEFPGLPYAAALIGAGSEVLGFDTERSTDHDWGPRLLVFGEDEGGRTARSGGSGRPVPRIRSWTARRPSAISVTPGPLPRYLVSDRDMSVLGVSDTQT